MIKIFNRFRRHFGPLLLPALFSLAIAFSLVQATNQAAARNLTADELKIVSSVNNYLNGFQNMEGHFVQISPSGKYTNGRFFISRPGRVRFEYEPPSPLMIVADGSWVSIENRKLKTSEHFPLSLTPLKIILAKNINLLKDADITHVFRDDKRITLTMHDKGSSKNGQITLVFQAGDMTLKEWIVIDGQGFQTRITVSDLVTGIKQNPKMFFIKTPEFPETLN